MVKQSPTDIVITSCGRLRYLRRTLTAIWERTRTPYLLHILDDNSDRDTVAWLLKIWEQGKIETLVLRNSRVGLRAQRNMGIWATFSDPFVISDDDVLCPDVDPDWLSRGLAAMEKHSDVGVLALNNPQDNVLFSRGRWDLQRVNNVQYSTDVYSCFAFIRREARTGWQLHHRKGQPVKDEGFRYPISERNTRIKKAGWKLAYLADTYCFHFGEETARPEKTGSRALPKTIPILPVKDDKTLEPDLSKVDEIRRAIRGR